jgi:hypothetical protein
MVQEKLDLEKTYDVILTFMFLGFIYVNVLSLHILSGKPRASILLLGSGIFIYPIYKTIKSRKNLLVDQILRDVSWSFLFYGFFLGLVYFGGQRFDDLEKSVIVVFIFVFIPTFLWVVFYGAKVEKDIFLRFMVDGGTLVELTVMNGKRYVYYSDEKRVVVTTVRLQNDNVVLERVPYKDGIYRVTVFSDYRGHNPLFFDLPITEKGIKYEVVEKFPVEINAEWILYSQYENTLCMGTGNYGICRKGNKWYITYLTDHDKDEIRGCWYGNISRQFNEKTCDFPKKEISEELAILYLENFDENILMMDFVL